MRASRPRRERLWQERRDEIELEGRRLAPSSARGRQLLARRASSPEIGAIDEALLPPRHLRIRVPYRAARARWPIRAGERRSEEQEDRFRERLPGGEAEGLRAGSGDGAGGA